MVKHLYVFTLLFIIFSLAFSKEKKEEPIVIEAEEFIFTGDKNIAIYRGNAKVRKGNFKLKAEEIKVFIKKNGDIGKLIAKGNVEFSYGNRVWGKAKNVYIDNIAQKITLKGNAELHQKNTVLTGDQIIFYIKENRVVVYGGKGKKVRTIIFPER